MAAQARIHVGKGKARKTYVLEYSKLTNVEAIAMEVATGRTLKEILLTLPESSYVSITAVVWILRRRDEPSLQFEEVKFELGDLEVEEVESGPAVPKEAAPPEQS